MDDLSRSAQKITLTLFAAQSLVSAAIIAAATLNSILGARLGGSASWAGVPTAVYLLVGAFSSWMWGYLMETFGRRKGLVAGMLLGVGGMGLAIKATNLASLPVFLLGMALLGSANAAMNLGRFAAAEVNPPLKRGRAISNVVVGGTVGAVLGPLLVGPSGQWASTRGMDELSGAYTAGLLLFILAGAVLFTRLRPDPRDLGREVTRQYPETGLPNGETRPVLQILQKPAALVAVLTMVVGQMVMVMVMVITSLHMRDHQHSLGQISVVFSAHTIGMFAFSVISGRLADRWGRGPVIITGTLTLVLACLAATLSPDVILLAVALFLLGLGWNFCYVGGSTLLADQLSPAERAHTQGFNDLLVGLAAALGSLGSGVVFATLGYNVMALLGAGLSLLPLVAAAAWNRKQPTPAPSI